MKLAETTNHKNIYMHTYWGTFDYAIVSTSLKDKKIIKNRNDFIKKFNIKKYIPNHENIKLLNKNKYIYLDHIELYYSNDKHHILIFNSYCKSNEYLNDGWELYNKKLYSMNCYTYIKIL